MVIAFSTSRFAIRRSALALRSSAQHHLISTEQPSFQQLTSKSRFRYSTATITDPAHSPSPSRLGRFAKFFAIAIVSASAGFTMTFWPVAPVVNEMLSPPSDKETLTMFTPSTDKISAQEEFIQTHPLVLSLRANPDFIEARPHLKIPASVREHHLTGGVLAGEGRLEVPPLQFTEKNGKSAVQIFYIGTDLCGHPGFIHGGAMATMLDEALARCCFQALPNKVGMTANLNINYRRPLPAGSFVAIKSTTTKVEGKKAWVEGTLENLPKEGEDRVVYCEADALFIEPKQAAMMARLYPASA